MKHTLLIMGLLITAVSWIIAWSGIPPYSEHSFFPLWVGYILTINGISELFFKDSLLRKMKSSFLLLFILSIPLWWFFEFVNGYIQNWQYILPHPLTDLEYAVRASISFSTVIPAVLSTSYLFFKLIYNRRYSANFPSLTIRPLDNIAAFILGALFLISVFLYPTKAFAVTWMAPFFIIEPINYWLDRPSFFKWAKTGNWTMWLAVSIGTLFTGFWWEFWNYYSMPKWIYTVPGLDFWKIFEMPPFGFLGYIPFGLSIYSFLVLVLPIFSRKMLNKINPSAPAEG